MADTGRTSLSALDSQSGSDADQRSPDDRTSSHAVGFHPDGVLSMVLRNLAHRLAVVLSKSSLGGLGTRAIMLSGRSRVVTIGLEVIGGADTFWVRSGADVGAAATICLTSSRLVGFCDN